MPALSDESSMAQGTSASWRTPAALLLLALAAGLSGADLFLSQMCVGNDLPGVLQKTFEAAEHFGTIYGQALIALVIWRLVPAQSRRIPRLLLAGTAGGLAANICKLLVARTRPKFFWNDLAPLMPDSLTIQDSFRGWFSMARERATLVPQPLLDDVKWADLQSLPSGHTTSAVAFALALGALYPRGRGIFLAIAGLVACQRVETLSHFPSDTLTGAALGWCVGTWWTRSQTAARLCSHWEAPQSPDVALAATAT